MNTRDLPERQQEHDCGPPTNDGGPFVSDCYSRMCQSVDNAQTVNAAQSSFDNGLGIGDTDYAMSNEAQSAIASIEKSMKSVERRLLAESADYRLLKHLEKAKAELQAARTAQLPDKIVASPQPGAAAPEWLDEPFKSRPLTQGDAAVQALTDAQEPLFVHELLEKIRALGVKVSGDRPHINLSSTLSRDKRFRNVKYKGQFCWWLAGKVFPGEELLKQTEDLLA